MMRRMRRACDEKGVGVVAATLRRAWKWWRECDDDKGKSCGLAHARVSLQITAATCCIDTRLCNFHLIFIAVIVYLLWPS